MKIPRNTDLKEMPTGLINRIKPEKRMNKPMMSCFNYHFMKINRIINEIKNKL
jgi:hypothetical protein